MNMKKTFIAAALVSGLVGMQAQASDGTIYFQGKLISPLTARLHQQQLYCQR